MHDLKALEANFNISHMPSEILLGSAKLLDASSRETPAFQDVRYFPFYYHLGKSFHQPIVVCQIGVKLGLIGACFMQGCNHSVEWQAMEEQSDNLVIPKNIVVSNLKQFAKADGGVTFRSFSDNSANVSVVEFPLGTKMADLCLLSEKYDKKRTQMYLSVLWEHLRSEGLLVIDYIHDDAIRESFNGFCRVINREPVIFDTRYRVGIVVK